MAPMCITNPIGTRLLRSTSVLYHFFFGSSRFRGDGGAFADAAPDADGADPDAVADAVAAARTAPSLTVAILLSAFLYALSLCAFSLSLSLGRCAAIRKTRHCTTPTRGKRGGGFAKAQRRRTQETRVEGGRVRGG